VCKHLSANTGHTALYYSPGGFVLVTAALSNITTWQFIVAFRFSKKEMAVQRLYLLVKTELICLFEVQLGFNVCFQPLDYFSDGSTLAI